MMKLSDEQIALVRQWAAEGETLTGIQKRLKSDLGLSATYLDTRLLVGDLGIELAEWKPKPPEEKIVEEKVEEAASPLLDETGNPPGGAPGAVKVGVDKITRPGAVVSGKATFSDGKTVGWQLDQMGRLGLVRDDVTYQPPAADLPEFQRQLDLELRKLGL